MGTELPNAPHERAARLALAIAGGNVDRAATHAEAQAAAADLEDSRQHWIAVAAEVRRLGAQLKPG